MDNDKNQTLSNEIVETESKIKKIDNKLVRHPLVNGKVRIRPRLLKPVKRSIIGKDRPARALHREQQTKARARDKKYIEDRIKAKQRLKTLERRLEQARLLKQVRDKHPTSKALKPICDVITCEHWRSSKAKGGANKGSNNKRGLCALGYNIQILRRVHGECKYYVKS